MILLKSMAKKKRNNKINVKKKKIIRKKGNDNSLSSEYKKIDKKITKFERDLNYEFNKEYLEARKWIISRRKIFLKLGILVIISIILLLIIIGSIDYFL